MLFCLKHIYVPHLLPPKQESKSYYAHFTLSYQMPFIKKHSRNKKSRNRLCPTFRYRFIVSLSRTSYMNDECLSWFYSTKIINYAQFIALISFPFISRLDCFCLYFLPPFTARIKVIIMAKACQQMVLPRHDIRPCGRFLLIICSIPFST